jgi:hypothetical protein
MNRQKSIITLCVATMMLAGMAQTASARGRKKVMPLTAQGEKLQAKYAGMLADLTEEVKRLEPKVDKKKKAEFLKQFDALRSVPSVTKTVRYPLTGIVKEVTLKCDPGNPAFVEKRKEVLTAARAVMKDIEASFAGEKAQAIMAKFALLTHATPNRLARFAQKGKEEKALIDNLLNDDKLVVQVMTLGGASGGRYGQAMRNYTAIRKATERSHKGFYQVWALAVCLQNTGDGYIYPDVPAAKSLVRYYLNYLKAYDDGVLDPAFSKLGGTGWNYRFVFPDSYTLEDIDWIRTMIRNYRPDHTRLEYRWRYCRIVRSDVPYTSSVMRPVRPDLNLSRIQDFFLKGGICGPRAFVGQISGYAFGIPTRRAPSPGHGAMAHWTPDGWTTVLGPHFYFCKHINGMPPMEFLLVSQAQQDPKGFKQVLMCEWLGEVLGEDAPGNYGSSGGFWRVLGFYKKHAIVEDQKIKDIGTTGEELAESNVSTEKEEIKQIKFPEKFRKITVAKDGTKTIPVAACKSPKNTEKIRFMETIDADAIQVHYCLGGGQPELLKFYVNAPKAGKYELTVHMCTVTVERSMLLRLNRRTLLNIAIPYTKGYWKDTEPLAIDLKEGRNTLLFTIRTPNKGASIKYFKLKPQN